MKRMCPPNYHHSGFVATYALGHIMFPSSQTLHHVPKCMSCHKAIVVITGRANCHDYMYITLILLLWDLSTHCVVDSWITSDHLQKYRLMKNQLLALKLNENVVGMNRKYLMSIEKFISIKTKAKSIAFTGNTPPTETSHVKT